MFGDARPQSRGVAPNRPHSSRAEVGAWRAPMRRDGGGHENFFVAKNHDSESARDVSDLGQRLASASTTQITCCMRIAEMPAVQAFPAILTNTSVRFLRTTCIIVQKIGCLPSRRALRALPLLHQHFLKLDAVFFNVLVYSGDSAFRFPSARSS